MKSKTKLECQNYGSSTLVFIIGETEQDAYWKWVSMYNWNCCSGSEPSYVTDKIISCWSSIERLKKYLFELRITELDKSSSKLFKGIPGGFATKAKELAEQDFAEIKWESYRSVNSEISLPYDMGAISAEKPDDDFKDTVYAYAFAPRD